MSPKPRVVIADAQPLIAEAFEKLLAAECEIVGRVSDGRALIDMVRVQRPDVVIVDSALPLLNGLDAGRQAKHIYSSLKAVIVTANEDPDLLRAIREVMRSHTYVTPLITDGMVHSMLGASIDELSSPELTSRQREVLQLLAEGKSMKQAANILHIGVRTVAFHKYRIMEQLKVKTSAELIRFAVQRHVV